jgi:hypothetical protein
MENLTAMTGIVEPRTAEQGQWNAPSAKSGAEARAMSTPKTGPDVGAKAWRPYRSPQLFIDNSGSSSM